MNELLLKKVRFMILHSIDESIDSIQTGFSKANDPDEFLRKNIYRIVTNGMNSSISPLFCK